MTVPRAPSGLGQAGRRLWRAAWAVYTFSPAEVEVLRETCTTLGELERLEVALGAAESLTVRGSTGQPRAHPLLEEVRRHRATLARLVAALNLPDEMVRIAGFRGRMVLLERSEGRIRGPAA